jgi:hypothetical protein
VCQPLARHSAQETGRGVDGVSCMVVDCKEFLEVRRVSPGGRVALPSEGLVKTRHYQRPPPAARSTCNRSPALHVRPVRPPRIAGYDSSACLNEPGALDDRFSSGSCRILLFSGEPLHRLRGAGWFPCQFGCEFCSGNLLFPEKRYNSQASATVSVVSVFPADKPIGCLTV